MCARTKGVYRVFASGAPVGRRLTRKRYRVEHRNGAALKSACFKTTVKGGAFSGGN